MGRIFAAYLFVLTATGQDVQIASEKLKVAGIANPFMVESVELNERSAGAGGGWVLNGRVLNPTKAALFDVSVLAIIKRVAGDPLKVEVKIDQISGEGFANFGETVTGLKSSEEADSIRFEALEFWNELELKRKEEDAEKRRLAIQAREQQRWEEEQARIKRGQAQLRQDLLRRCRAVREKIGEKTVGSLTVNEADVRERCKAAGAW